MLRLFARTSMDLKSDYFSLKWRLGCKKFFNVAFEREH